MDDKNKNLKKSQYQSYIQEYIVRMQDNQDFLKNLAKQVQTKQLDKKKNQLILRPASPIVVWTETIVNRPSDNPKKPILNFPEPEKIPKKNLLKEAEVEVMLDSELDDIKPATETQDLSDLPDFLQKKGKQKAKELDKNQNLYRFFEEQKKNISIDQEKLDKIKQKLTANQVFEKDSGQSFLKSIFSTFTSDFFWQSIAITMLVAVLIFFFQGLQPNLIRAYSQQARDKTTLLNNSFNRQIATFYEMQILVSQRFNYDPTLLCTETEKYEFLSDDLNQLRSLRNSLSPDLNLQELDKAGPFFDREILAVYQNSFQTYQNKSNQSLEKSQRLDSFLNFLNYRNNWILACQKMQENNFNQTSREASCQDLSTATKVFVEQGLTDLSTEIQNQLQTSLEVCNLESISADNFESRWFVGYDLVMGYIPDFNALNQEILELAENLNTQTAQDKARIKELENQKTSFPGILHILDF